APYGFPVEHFSLAVAAADVPLGHRASLHDGTTARRTCAFENPRLRLQPTDSPDSRIQVSQVAPIAAVFGCGPRDRNFPGGPTCSWFALLHGDPSPLERI